MSLAKKPCVRSKTWLQGLVRLRKRRPLVYQYLQDNTRYVSIQLGIGGFKPFSAGKVDQWGYGDCKALSNYMVTLLQEVGVDAYYTLIYSGKDNHRTSPDFPANNFNHVIVCLPAEGDTLWMECTSQVLPFNYLGSSTSDRYALLIDGADSKLVRTPRSTAEKSVQDTHFSMVVSEDGSLEMDLVRTASGKFLGLYSYLAEASADDTEKWLRKRFGKTKTHFSEVGFASDGQEGRLALHLSQPQAARQTGKYLFVPRSFENKVVGIEPIDEGEARKLPIHVEAAQTLRYTWEVSLPEGFEASRIPKDVLVENQFGRLQQIAKLVEGRLVTEVELVLQGGMYEASEAGLYNELAAAWKKALTSKFVLTEVE